MNLAAALVNTLTAALAVSAGLAFAVASATRRSWPAWTAGFIITAVVVVAVFALGAPAAWVGPIFALVAVTTGLLGSASFRRDEPAFAGKSYGERVRLVLSPRYVRAVEEARHEDQIHA